MTSSEDPDVWGKNTRESSKNLSTNSNEIDSPAKAGKELATKGSDELEEKVDLDSDNMKHQDDASKSLVINDNELVQIDLVKTDMNPFLLLSQ